MLVTYGKNALRITFKPSEITKIINLSIEQREEITLAVSGDRLCAGVARDIQQVVEHGNVIPMRIRETPYMRFIGAPMASILIGCRQCRIRDLRSCSGEQKAAHGVLVQDRPRFAVMQRILASIGRNLSVAFPIAGAIILPFVDKDQIVIEVN